MFTPTEVQEIIDQAVEKSLFLLHENRIADAEVVLKQLLKVSPNNQSGLQLLGLARHRAGKYKEAVELFKSALEGDQNNANNHNNIALAYGGLHEYQLSIEHLYRAIDIKPDNPDFYNNMGMMCRNKGGLRDALFFFTKALELRPNDKLYWFNIGSTFGECRDLEEAERCLGQAIILDQNFAAAHVDMAYCHHLQGKWSLAWEEYEWRFQCFPRMQQWIKACGPEKLWNGKDSLKNKTISVWCEQGVGDAIMFSRYIPFLKAKGCRIKLIAHPEVEQLFAQQRNLSQANFPVDEVWCCDVGDTDYHCSIISLPYLLGMTKIPPSVLWSCPHEWDDYSDRYKVGVVWAGSPSHPGDRHRSIPVKQLEPLTKIPGIQIICLQKDHRPRAYWDAPQPVNLSQGWENMAIAKLKYEEDNWPDLSGMACLVKGLDLVITVDTAMLHLAGSVGTKTWGLIPYNPDWRWKLEGETTEWYPSVKLFRQSAKGDWDSVLTKITGELVKQVNGL